MDTKLLNGTWRCTLPDGQMREVRVPGCVEQVWDEWGREGPFVYETDFEYHGDKKALLQFDGVSYHSAVYLNDRLLGEHEGLWDSFTLDCSQAIREGSNHLRLRIVKPGYLEQDAFPLRQVLSGFVPDVLTTFGGIWDEVRLLQADSLFVLEHRAEGNCAGGGLLLAEISAASAGKLRCSLTVSDGALEVHAQTREFHIPAGPQTIRLPFQVDEPRLWAPASPALYRYRLRLSLGGCEHEAAGRFGFREVRAQGRQLLLNGQPFYLRGILHWGYDDDLIIPNPDEDKIRKELTAMKAHGFNAVKHCLYIPRKRYLDLMDELGMLAWVELPLWLPDMTPALSARIIREYPRILRCLRGHPSLALLSLGCELDNKVPEELLKNLYNLARHESGVPVRDNSGSGECYGGLSVDFADFYDYHFYAELPHLEELVEHFTPAWREERPWIFGEFCDSDTMRDLARVREGKGVAALSWERDDKLRNPVSLLKPDFYLGSHDQRMEESGIRKDLDEILSLSYDHSLVHRKVTLELTRSFPEICGYNITSIRDVPIATSGLVDDLGQTKFDPGLFRSFNSDAVLTQAFDLSRVWLGADRVLPAERYNFLSGSLYSVRLLLSNYLGRGLSGCVLSYRLARQGETCLEGRMDVSHPLPHASVREAARLNLRLPAYDRPATLLLSVRLEEGGQTVAYNEFPVFVYPAAPTDPGLLCYDPAGSLFGLTRHLQAEFVTREEGLPSPEEGRVLVSGAMTDAVRRYVEQGGRLLLLLPGGGSLPTLPGPMWREGMIRAYPHPVMEELVRECRYDDLRYFSMTPDHAIDSGALAAWGARDVAPVIRRYDCRAWTRSEYLCTFRLGRGVCAATTLRLGGGLGKTPIFARQNPFAGYLLHRLVRHLKED